MELSIKVLSDRISLIFQGGSPVANDDFSGTLAQWTTVMGTGFSIQNGELVNTSGGPDNILINSSAGVMGNGSLTVDVKTLSSDGDPGIVFRYQDNDNFYLIDPWAAPNVVTICKRIPNGYQWCSSVHVPTMVMGTSYRVQVVMTGANIQVYWNGSPVVGFTDGNPLLLGKVGFRQCMYRICKWDNMIVSMPDEAALLATARVTVNAHPDEVGKKSAMNRTDPQRHL